jgi:hypothetical protein
MKGYSLGILYCFFLLLISYSADAQIFRRKANKAKTELPAPPSLPETTEKSPKANQEIKATSPSEVPDKVSTAPDQGASPATEQPGQDTYPMVSRPNDQAPMGEPVIQQKPNGQVNWSNQYIEATGSAVIDLDRFPNAAQARLMAIRGAVVVAQRNLLEIVNGVHVVGETTVQDMMTLNDLIITRVEGLIKGAQMIGDPIERFGAMEVTLRMPLYAQNGLASTLHEDASELMKKQKSDGSYQMEQAASGVAKALSAGELPAIAFRLNGKTLNPALFPVILDEKGNLVFDLTKIYDPRTGRFPQILQTTRDLFDAAGYAKGVEVIDVIDSFDGKIVIDSKQARKINWGRIGRIAASVGSVLLTIL